MPQSLPHQALGHPLGSTPQLSLCSPALMSVNLLNKVLLAALPALLLGVAAALAAGRSVPHGFFGVHWAPELRLVPAEAQDFQWDLMASSGVEALRADFFWSSAQPARGAPIDFSFSDGLVRRAALRDIELLPVVNDAPRWARAFRHARHVTPARPRRVHALSGRTGRPLRVRRQLLD